MQCKTPVLQCYLKHHLTTCIKAFTQMTKNTKKELPSGIVRVSFGKSMQKRGISRTNTEAYREKRQWLTVYGCRLMIDD
ncbi:hypothetical protein ATB99_07765 [Elizabethkingia meningoseptica]|nr:hypothetical protein BBD33_13455 [Elizabethkingia meningoseptica]AQX48244.1 hypothetical protein B5G46_13450 [Elizabethkingia meningoseptica]KUY16328.1 hypothetical protein ATB99_07765 [Elizabethkingia meningoseptica]OPB68081.1 hypothetical protein BAY30_08890 [Elizabethkingia meningoseptica]